jgi:predicted TIM-barrel fold metal-dependent hydrolase
VKRQVWFSGDPDESSFEPVSKVIPPNRLLWASDFPHLDILWDEESVTEELYERLRLLDDDIARQILGLNALEVYGIDVELHVGGRSIGRSSAG